jgi:DNA-binding NarL/FixJ family response regulator
MKSNIRDNGTQFRVLLVAQDPALGHRLAQLLDGPSGFRLCRHVLDAAAAQSAIAAENPDLVVVDTDPENLGAFQLLRSIAGASDEPRILATSCRCDPAAAEKVLRASARGLLFKTDPPEEILSAFRAVTRGQIYVCRAVTMLLLKRLLSAPSQPARNGVESLTDRELGVFELLGAGLSKRAVAARLGLSCKTIESHAAKIQHRLGIKNAAALTVFACTWVQRGIRPSSLLSASHRSAVGERSVV